MSGTFRGSRKTIASTPSTASLKNGVAVTVVLVMLGEGEVETAYGRLAAEGIRDVRPLASEQMLSDLCQSEMNRTPYMVSVG